MFHSFIQVSNTSSSPSSIVAILSIPKTSGPSPSLVSCTSVLWVRIYVHREMAAALKANVDNIAIGILYIYQNGQPGYAWSAIPYFSISLSLNIILTLMIVIRLTLHARGVRTAMGGTGSGGLCKAIVTMFIESCAMYSVISVLVLAMIGVGSSVLNIFMLILAQTQVRTSL